MSLSSEDSRDVAQTDCVNLIQSGHSKTSKPGLADVLHNSLLQIHLNGFGPFNHISELYFFYARFLDLNQEKNFRYTDKFSG